MQEYGINSLLLIRHFISQVTIESGYGKCLIEKYNGDSHESYFENRDFHKYNTIEGDAAKKNDGAKYRGAGYMQLTWKISYNDFGKFVNDRNGVQNGAPCIKDK